MYMSEKFGAWQVGVDEDQGAVEFTLFFPDRERDASQYEATRQTPQGEVADFGDPKIESIQVAGDFQSFLEQQDWDRETAPRLTREPHSKGWVWRYQTPVELPKGFYQYKYYVTFQDGTKRLVSDPCTRYGGSQEQNSGVVVGGSHSDVEPLSDGRQPLRDLIIYELMIDDFTDEFRGARAPLDAVRDKLDYLQHTLGITAILFMPWTAWPGEGFSWGYTPYQYFSVEYRYSDAINDPAEKLSWLKQLVTECHERGLHVIMDGVFNHVGDMDPESEIANGFPYLWLYQDPLTCPYVGTFGGVFSGLKDLDFHNGCTQAFIRDVCFYWMDIFQVDGIRFDNTTNFFVENDARGLPTLLREIREHLEEKDEQNFSLTLEHLDLAAAPVTNLTGATSYWNNELYQRCFDSLWDGQIDTRLLSALNNQTGLDADKVATTYIGNHDHSHVAWQAGARDNAGALQWYRTQPYVLALLTSPGAVMIQNGQEFAEDYWMMEDDKGSNRRVKPRPLRWDFLHDSIGSKLVAVYRMLIQLRNAHPGLRSANIYPDRWESWQTQFDPQGYGVNVEKGVIIYHRWGEGADGRLERCIIVLNFSATAQVVDIPFSTNGEWQDLLNGNSDTVTEFQLLNQQIESNWGRLYYQQA